MSFSKKVAFHTLGCKVNQYETESIKNQLIKRGYEEVPFEDKSDIYIINSCTVTSIADRKTDYNQSCLPLMQKGFIIKGQKNSTFKIIARYFSGTARSVSDGCTGT